MSTFLYHTALYFLIYSFLGWCLEVIYAAVQKRKFVNRGLLNGVLCPVYGLSMTFILIFFSSLKSQVFFLFCACFIITSVVEFLAGTVTERLMGRKCWDYSGYRDHLGSYVCIRFSLIWAVIAVLAVKFLHPWLESAIDMIPKTFGEIIALLLTGLTALDMITTAAALRKIKNDRLLEIAKGIRSVSGKLDRVITGHVARRMENAFPSSEDVEAERERKWQEREAKKHIFAYGCGFHKLVWLFFLGAFLGDIVETIFCLLTTGRLMSRSSVVYGPFSIVWGLGIAFFTFLLQRYQNRSDSYLFFMGTVLGGAYEYICSVFTELVFGTVFWDYSKIPFNLGGRINLLYCFFWGIAAVIWMKRLYPHISGWIEKIPIRIGKTLSWLFVVFMVVNMAISGLALTRYTNRNNGIAASNAMEEFLDERFDDARMERIYPNAIMK